MKKFNKIAKTVMVVSVIIVAFMILGFTGDCENNAITAMEYVRRTFIVSLIPIGEFVLYFIIRVVANRLK